MTLSATIGIPVLVQLWVTDVKSLGIPMAASLNVAFGARPEVATDDATESRDDKSAEGAHSSTGLRLGPSALMPENPYKSPEAELREGRCLSDYAKDRIALVVTAVVVFSVLEALILFFAF